MHKKISYTKEDTFNELRTAYKSLVRTWRGLQYLGWYDDHPREDRDMERILDFLTKLESSLVDSFYGDINTPLGDKKDRP